MVNAGAGADIQSSAKGKCTQPADLEAVNRGSREPLDSRESLESNGSFDVTLLLELIQMTSLSPGPGAAVLHHLPSNPLDDLKASWWCIFTAQGRS